MATESKLQFSTELADHRTQTQQNMKKEKEEKREEKKEKEAESKIVQKRSKRDVWMHFSIQLKSIDTKNQSFKISASIDAMWYDKEFVIGDFKTKHNINDTKYIQTIAMHDFTEKFHYRLPCHPSNLFVNTLETTVDPRGNWKLWINPLNYGLHLSMNFEGVLTEHLETKSFPFDSQFLNIKFKYDSRNYNILSQCPDWVYMDSPYVQYHIPISVTKSASIVQWNMLSPWIDCRIKPKYFYPQNNQTETIKFEYGLLRLRVQRNPYYFLLYIVFPLILITLSSFAVIGIDDEDIGSRLGYLVTLLLTVAAFQYAMSGELPDSAELTNIDKLILCGYLIETFFILYVTISALLQDENHIDLVELIFPIILAVIWLLCVMMFVLYPCFKYIISDVNWKEISDIEFREFNENDVMNPNNYQMTTGDFMYGSMNGGEISENIKDAYFKYNYDKQNGKRTLTFQSVNEKEFNQIKDEWDKNPTNKISPKPVYAKLLQIKP